MSAKDTIETNQEINVDKLTYESAKNGDLEAVQKYVKEGGSIHLALIGGSDAKNNAICNWAINNGACYLFGIQQEYQDKEKLIKYSKPISMLKGPGEVPKGTFNTGGLFAKN